MEVRTLKQTNHTMSVREVVSFFVIVCSLAFFLLVQIEHGSVVTDTNSSAEAIERESKRCGRAAKFVQIRKQDKARDAYCAKLHGETALGYCLQDGAA